MQNRFSGVLQKRAGSLYLLVVLIIVSISVLAGKFFQISRQRQSSSFRLEQNLLAREIAESAHNEAYAQIVNQTTDRESDLAKWLVAKNNHEVYQLDLPSTESIKQQLLKPNFSAEIKCELKKIDFRSNSHELIDYTPPDQGQGTLAIKIEIEIFHGLINARKLLSASLTMHHDYLVVAMVSRRNNFSARTGYSQSFPLDYSLLIRDGLKESREYSGKVPDGERKILIIDQKTLTPDNCGKICFSGTDAGNSLAGDTPSGYVVIDYGHADKTGISPAPRLNASQPFNPTPGSLNLPVQELPAPIFFNRQNGPVSLFSTGANGFQAYGNFELWSRRRLKRDDLVRLRIIDFDKKIIRPRGIIHTAETDGLTFEAGAWKIEGCGVLIAPKFSIAGPISKSTDKDMLVLFARKEGIEVITDQRIESALIAVNDDLTGCVTVLKKLDLKGAIIADRLNLALWNPGSHKIEYDPAFKLKDKDVYITSLSRWTTFQSWKIN